MSGQAKDKTPGVVTYIRLSETDRARLQEAAKREDRTLSAQIRYLAMKGLEELEAVA